MLGERWSQPNDTTDQKRRWNWTVAHGVHWRYSDCLKEETECYKRQRPAQISIMAHTAKIVGRILGRMLDR
jgi:hypothetical protein